jgi:uncharacterized SAM-binding protein YcdF (DUF218 family)
VGEGDLFFALSKILWAAIRPESLLLGLLALGLLLSGRFPRTGRTLLATGLTAALALALWPFGALVLRPLETRFPTAPDIVSPAGIVLLGGSEERGLAARWGVPQVNAAGDRYLATLDLARQFPDAIVIFAGGGASRVVGPNSEAALARRILTGAGLPVHRLRLEDRSRNTAENAAFALARRPPGTEAGPWILVTSAFHMPRAVASFCAAGWQGLVPWPTDHRGAGLHRGWDFARNLDALNTGTREWVGLLAYRLTGRTTSLWPEGCSPAN